ncbi:MAG: hypothetical protein JNM22_02820 [Saprospiraceae bacterium]|nr:hypothetical protein [Saprospiraceae bacterium]
MNFFEEIFLLEQLDHLIRIRGTGSPKQLASRLKICERHVYRLINHLRDQGFPIEYDKKSQSYFYSELVELTISFKVNGKKLLSINGGEENIHSVSLSDFFCHRHPETLRCFINGAPY